MHPRQMEITADYAITPNVIFDEDQGSLASVSDFRADLTRPIHDLGRP